MLAFAVDTTRKTLSRVHSSAREKKRERERRETRRKREPKEGDGRGAPVRARGTLTFTR